MNVASGRINSDPTINAELAITIGSKQTASFIQKLPCDFYETLNVEEKVKCLVPPQRGMKIGETKVINTEAVYHRIIGLLATDHVTLKDVIKYELSSVPPSLFKENGDMRTAESKYKIKEILQVETSARNMKDVAASFVDGSAIFWILKWPEKCSAEMIGEGMYEYVKELLYYHDVYLVFGRYKDYSIKSATRNSRAKNF